MVSLTFLKFFDIIGAMIKLIETVFRKSTAINLHGASNRKAFDKLYQPCFFIAFFMGEPNDISRTT